MDKHKLNWAQKRVQSIGGFNRIKYGTGEAKEYIAEDAVMAVLDCLPTVPKKVTDEMAKQFEYDYLGSLSGRPVMPTWVALQRFLDRLNGRVDAS